MEKQTDLSEKYFYKKNPKQGSRFPYLIFDFEANLHLPLTSFSKYLKMSYAPNTIRCYLHEVILFFSWYHNKHSLCNGLFWQQKPEQIRILIKEYLLIKLKCQLKTRGGYCLIFSTNCSPKTISILLSALRCFYDSTISNEYYKFKNPLIGFNLKLNEKEDISLEYTHFPKMPYISGVSELKQKQRLTDAYFILAKNEWLPYIVNDKELPNRIFNAGKLIKWTKRQNLITMLLFETGARVSEVCGLTIGDWYARGLNNEATSFSKGSFQRRVKFVRWSNNTTKLLREYFDTERIKFDKNRFKLMDYINLEKIKKIDLYSVPIFITNRGTPLAPNVYRDLYWNPACKKVGLRVNIHQIRHWYVSKIIEEIYSLKLSKEDYDRKVDELIQYMNWRSGRRTLEVYEHFFGRMEHQLLQDTLHLKLDEQLKSNISYPPSLLITQNVNDQSNLLDDPELDYLWGLGGVK
ncbi:site-specific integrase [Acinetobacter calcoaceticus]|uniref:site-specific integrase n=1 Tax=Acinetobacter calcoaceticus TaxID=471 RepID=UPI00192C2DBF|nr:site-specific integrase [Acinetobacter calcoaceticus]